MRSDVPVGAFLSGGLDSASVVAAMSAHSERRVRTCTIGFEGGSDERPLARLVAERFNTEHSEAMVGREHAEGLLHRLAWHFDEPFADTSSLPSYVVSKIARELVTVVLTGDGGDEVLGGYPVHQSEKLASMWQQLPKPIRGATSTVSESLSSLSRLPPAFDVRAERAVCSTAPTRISSRASSANRSGSPRRKGARSSAATPACGLRGNSSPKRLRVAKRKTGSGC